LTWLMISWTWASSLRKAVGFVYSWTVSSVLVKPDLALISALGTVSHRRTIILQLFFQYIVSPYIHSFNEAVLTYTPHANQVLKVRTLAKNTLVPHNCWSS
jgi:hypothetical protein